MSYARLTAGNEGELFVVLFSSFTYCPRHAPPTEGGSDLPRVPVHISGLRTRREPCAVEHSLLIDIELFATWVSGVGTG